MWCFGVLICCNFSVLGLVGMIWFVGCLFSDVVGFVAVWFWVFWMMVVVEC